MSYAFVYVNIIRTMHYRPIVNYDNRRSLSETNNTMEILKNIYILYSYHFFVSPVLHDIHPLCSYVFHDFDW